MSVEYLLKILAVEPDGRLRVDLAPVVAPEPEPPEPPAPSGPPALNYVGSFRVPAMDGVGTDKDHTYSYGGNIAAVHQGVLWLGTHVHSPRRAGPITIPEPVPIEVPGEFGSLPIAATIGETVALTPEDVVPQWGGSYLSVGGIASDGDDLRWVWRHTYNVSHSERPVLGSLWQPQGPWWIRDAEGNALPDQLTGQWIIKVPEPWASTLGPWMVGGGVAAGYQHGALSAYALDRVDGDAVATEIVRFGWDDPGHGLNPASAIHGAVIVGDWLLISVTRGVGEVWYGNGTSPSGKVDPYSNDQGQHAEDYERELLAFPLASLPSGNALAAVVLDFPFETQPGAHGVKLTQDGNRVYAIETRVDRSRDPYARHPIVHVLEVG